MIKNDRCIYVGPDPGPWELRAGEPPWSHRPSEAPFRMPLDRAIAEKQATTADENVKLNEAPSKRRTGPPYFIFNPMTRQWEFGPPPGIVRKTPVLPQGVPIPDTE